MADEQANVVTRFAPSPTGFLHIGGARTALYNWLFAKKHGGRFLLRIEDTDRKRSSQEAVDAILSGMEWLGLDHDGDVISQFARAARHQEVALALLSEGKAYKCFATAEELAAARDAARAAGKNFRGDLWRDRDQSEAPKDAPYTVRIKMPREGSTVIEDRVQGRVEVANAELDDMILLRSDGTPTYMLSVVVDDHDMGVTHIIRGDDHLNNAFRQAAIYHAMEWSEPVYAHIPLIHGPDGKKLSKRHGALGVDAYADMGFLPEAMRNYLLRLGWSHGDDEIIASEDAIRWFDLEHIGASAARFDFDKLDFLNAHYLRALTPAQQLDLMRASLEGLVKHSLDSQEEARLLRAMPTIADRSKRIPDLAENAEIFCHCRPLKLDEKAAKLLASDVAMHLGKLGHAMEAATEWSGPTIKDAMMQYAESAEIKPGKLMQTVRAALTGGRPSGDLMEIMEILGKDETLARIYDQAGKSA